MAIKRLRIDGQETKSALLSAAIELFAKKGFWAATNVDICKRAKANIAAINYHFGSKENLYIEAWKDAFQKSIARYPADGGVLADIPVQERLYKIILSMMYRISDPETYDLDIVHREMAARTGLLDEVIEEAMKRLDVGLEHVIEELLGEKAEKKEVDFCHMAIIGQCFGPMIHLRRRKAGDNVPVPKELPVNINIEELARQIVQYNLDGIAGIRGKF
jgi:TetR/AcrR family transcriptional regulator, regulator of cefoperazone and chloramphenicol sensitivity